MERKKLRKRGKEGKFRKSEKKRENIEALYKRLKKKSSWFFTARIIELQRCQKSTES